MDLREIVLKYALQNAVFYKGKANASSVMGKVMSEHHEARSDVSEVRKLTDRIVREVNLLSPAEQKKKLEHLAPDLLEKREKKQEGLSELEGAEDGKVVTRFAPSPTGPLSIGQFMRAVFLSYSYAKKYRGKFILRIEDTDAKKIEPSAYEWLKEDLARMGTKWDSLVLQSDRIPVYYKYAKILIHKEMAYVCTCPPEKFQNHKLAKSECPCRANDADKNTSLWESMVSGEFDDGTAVLRLRTNMADPNPVLRDPPMARVSKTPHPLKSTKFSVWPLYNFSCSIDDHELGVTHVFRGKEHEHNTAVQKKVSDIFGWPFPRVTNFGMIRFTGGPQHTRDIREMIAKGEVTGWDDPRLPTIRALLRRGFQPEAIKNLALQCGLSKNDIELSWDNLDGQNRKIVDSIANRYMVVADPVVLNIEGLPERREVFESLHPDFPERGKKKVPVNPKAIYISNGDFLKFKGGVIRLKGLCNVSLAKKPSYIGDEIMKDMQKVQWVSEPNLKVRIVGTEGVILGIGELELSRAVAGSVIQMERIGFGRIDANDGKEVVVYFAHK
jgi:glutamyl-tRNA synthetase